MSARVHWIRKGEGGQALVTVLLAMAFLTPLATFALMQARLDLQVEDNTRAALETFVTAEAGLEHALADLNLDPSFDRLLLGPDGVASTGDDDEFGYVGETLPLRLDPPFRYEVTVERLAPDAVEITANGYGFRGARRAVAARVRRDPDVSLPAAASSTALAVDVVIGPDFIVDGTDRAAHDPPRPALVVASQPVRERTLTALTSSAAAHLVGSGGTPSVALADTSRLVAHLGRAAHDARAMFIASADSLGAGLYVSQGTLTLNGDARGSGMLFVAGDLEVFGQLVFSGLIVVSGDVRFAGQSDAHVTGGVIQGLNGRRLELLGAGRITYDSAALADLDALYPGLLPHGVIVTGWREVF